MNIYFNIKTYLRNLKVFHKTLTTHQGWDYEGSMQALRDAISNMEKVQGAETTFVALSRDATCKRMRVVVHALDRLIEDEYVDLKDFDYVVETSNIHTIKLKDLPSIKMKYKVSKSQKELDKKIVAAFVKKYWFSCYS